MTARQGREALARFSPTERQLFQDGLMGQVLKHFSGNGGLIQNTDRTNVMNRIGKSDAAREKLEVGLGPQGWRQMEAMLRTENIFDRMRGAVKGNSSTIKQYMAIAAAGGFGGYEEGGPEGGLSGASMAALMLGGTKAMKAKIDEKVMLQVAKMLVSRDANVVQRGRDVLARSNSLMNALRHIDTATAKGVGSEAGSYTPPRVYITKD